MSKNLFLFFVFVFSFSSLSQSTCTSRDQSENMCKGYGFCTMIPLGSDGATCGNHWSIPENWKAMKTDCLSNAERKKTYHCANGGVVKNIICGKSNCFVCKCN